MTQVIIITCFFFSSHRPVCGQRSVHVQAAPCEDSGGVGQGGERPRAEGDEAKDRRWPQARVRIRVSREASVEQGGRSSQDEGLCLILFLKLATTCSQRHIVNACGNVDAVL